jgi:hypothetical protein
MSAARPCHEARPLETLDGDLGGNSSRVVAHQAQHVARLGHAEHSQKTQAVHACDELQHVRSLVMKATIFRSDAAKPRS